MNTPEDDRAKSARYLETRGLEPVCRETGAEAISGTCPVHKGDRCLVVAAVSPVGVEAQLRQAKPYDPATFPTMDLDDDEAEAFIRAAKGEDDPVGVEGEDEGGWRAVANDFQRAMFDERQAVEAADYLIDLLKWIIGGGVVRDLDEAKAAYYAARNESRAQRASPTDEKGRALNAGEPCPRCGMRHADPLDMLDGSDSDDE